MNALLKITSVSRSPSHKGLDQCTGEEHGQINFSPDNIWSLKSKKKIKFDNLSSGQRNLFSLISILGSEGDGPILIDEPELSLHMDWQRP